MAIFFFLSFIIFDLFSLSHSCLFHLFFIPLWFSVVSLSLSLSCCHFWASVLYLFQNLSVYLPCPFPFALIPVCALIPPTLPSSTLSPLNRPLSSVVLIYPLTSHLPTPSPSLPLSRTTYPFIFTYFFIFSLYFENSLVSCLSIITIISCYCAVNLAH